jgi:hypothetical protein
MELERERRTTEEAARPTPWSVTGPVILDMEKT